MKTKIIAGITLLIAVALAFFYYQFNRSHTDIAKEKPDVMISANQLFESYSNNENEANDKYLGKIIEVKGLIYSIEKGDIEDINILLMEENGMFGISCKLSNNETINNLKKGQEISIKGECSGMLSDVILIRCVITKK